MRRHRQATKPQVDDTEDSDEEWMPRQQGEEPGGFKGVLKLTWVQEPAASQEVTTETLFPQNHRRSQSKQDTK